MAPPRSTLHRLRRFAGIDRRERTLLIEAALLLALARIALKIAPFPWLARRLGRFVTPAEARRLDAAARPADPDSRVAADVSIAIGRAAGALPFEVVCLPRAIASRMMLARRGVASVLHFGAATGGEKPFEAHAWLDAAGVEVTGYPATGFTEIACFV